MKTKILALLRENGDYLSGQELCSRFGVSRTAVWKSINQLKEDGYVIEAVQNKGYRLIGCPEILSETELKSRMKTAWAGKNLYYHKQTGSTNIDAKKLAEEGAVHGTLVVADMQNAGRGRRGRSWQAPAGNNIYMSIALKPEFPPDRASALTLVMALSVAEAMQAVCDGEYRIKWPNDIVLNGKKLCGILTEMSAETDYIHYVVIGVGINVNQTEFPQELQETATSVFKETGKVISRAGLIERILMEFEKNYDHYLETLNLAGLMERYNALLINRGREVKVLDPKGEYTGIAEGITESGELRVKKSDGEVVLVYAGEVSVRGLYGYV